MLRLPGATNAATALSSCCCSSFLGRRRSIVVLQQTRQRLVGTGQRWVGTRQRWVGSAATETTGNHASRSSQQQQQQQQQPPPPQRHHRNPVLAAVVREGLPLLNETAVKIQASPVTRQPFTTIDHDDGGHQAAGGGVLSSTPVPPPKVAYLQHHLREAATECLEEWTLAAEEEQEATGSYHHRRSPPPPSSSLVFGEWSVRGLPVEILAIQLSKSLQHADLFWALPRPLWVTAATASGGSTHNATIDNQPDKNRTTSSSEVLDKLLELQQLLHEQWTTTTTSFSRHPRRPAADRLATAIQQRLRLRQWSRVPLVRLKPATPHLLLQALEHEQQDHN